MRFSTLQCVEYITPMYSPWLSNQASLDLDSILQSHLNASSINLYPSSSQGVRFPTHSISSDPTWGQYSAARLSAPMIYSLASILTSLLYLQDSSYDGMIE